MGNPLLLFWSRLFGPPEPERAHPAGPDHLGAEFSEPPAGILLVMRRMRLPLITLILIFTVSVLGLTMIPGIDDAGNPHWMSAFDAFYFMAYTATTIGFGEIPHQLTVAQRMWVTIVIFVGVIGWAYAIGSLLALSQDRGFRRTVARRRAATRIARLNEPFLLVVGYGGAAKHLVRSLDGMGRRIVVLDYDENRVSEVDLDAYRADVPALTGNARDTRVMVLAGLTHPRCEGIVSLTGDNLVNLDVALTSAMLRPGLPVIARTSSREVAARMRAFGVQEVVNPLDRFGNHLRIVLRAPAGYQLMSWLTSAPGSPLPARYPRLPKGGWVICGSGNLAVELTEDLRAEGLAVTVLDESHALATAAAANPLDGNPALSAALVDAVGFVAAADDDTSNLWLLEAARRLNPAVFLVVLQQRVSNVPLFEALGVDFAMAPADVVSHEVMAQVANPALYGFLKQVPHRSDEWSQRQLRRLIGRCGRLTPDLWNLRLNAAQAPTLMLRLKSGAVTIGDLLRSPGGREHQVGAVVLGLIRAGITEPAPADEELLQPDDTLLIAGNPEARRAIDATVSHEPTAAYVLEDRFVPSSWLWRRLAGVRSGDISR